MGVPGSTDGDEATSADGTKTLAANPTSASLKPNDAPLDEVSAVSATEISSAKSGADSFTASDAIGVDSNAPTSMFNTAPIPNGTVGDAS